ncbi:MAG TPA: transcriptional regulator, partial [Vicinamibacteria bacterium]|nr:transcriptional regulator [Vicinamibacteria bacterium]
RHLDVLKEAGIVEIWKGYEGRRPKTLVRLTRSGRERFTDYLAELERLVKDAQRAKEVSSKAPVPRLAVDPV